MSMILHRPYGLRPAAPAGAVAQPQPRGGRRKRRPGAGRARAAQHYFIQSL